MSNIDIAREQLSQLPPSDFKDWVHGKAQEFFGVVDETETDPEEPAAKKPAAKKKTAAA